MGGVGDILRSVPTEEKRGVVRTAQTTCMSSENIYFL